MKISIEQGESVTPEFILVNAYQYFNDFKKFFEMCENIGFIDSPEEFLKKMEQDMREFVYKSSNRLNR